MPKRRMPTARIGERLVSIGKVVKLRRVTLGWSQRDLAKEASLSLDVVNRVELGHRAANLGTLMVLADALGMDLAELLAERSDQRRAPTAAEEQCSKLIARLVTREPHILEAASEAIKIITRLDDRRIQQSSQQR